MREDSSHISTRWVAITTKPANSRMKPPDGPVTAFVKSANAAPVRPAAYAWRSAETTRRTMK